MKIPVILHGEIELDKLPVLLPNESRYFIRATAPDGAQGRTWDKLVRDYTPQGKCFKPGREIMIRREDVFAWIEAHPVEREAKPSVDSEASAGDPIDFAEFKRTALRKRASK